MGGKRDRSSGQGCLQTHTSATCYRPLAPCPHPHAAGRAARPSAAGSPEIQRGEGAELRGQGAAQPVVVKGPASKRGAPAREGERGAKDGLWKCAGRRGQGMCAGHMPALRAIAVRGRARGTSVCLS